MIEARRAVMRHMALAALRLPENVAGDFFVDTSCIDCDACRLIAPSVFHDTGEQSAVFHQPETPEELLRAQQALITCPTASIGDVSKRDMRAAVASFPEQIDGDVHVCGFNSESSFGAFSYFITHPNGNVLIDSPRFAGPLVKRMEELGGVRRMLLTHQDDVADHEKFHERFGCERVLHRDDVRSKTAAVEHQPTGLEPVEIDDGLLMIPTPGHTRGHAVFLYRDKYLFTGDHLAWNERTNHLYAFRSACWYSWSEQIESMQRLLDYRFEWVLPGHGRPVNFSAERMHDELAACVDWMRTKS
ncbi:MAG: beta-lactamase domain protein [Acidobacteria bacterium]|nr:beta-lactamase domain protein [Acidobacteriota bacterium]